VVVVHLAARAGTDRLAFLRAGLVLAAGHGAAFAKGSFGP
jgi:hypothetical protein